MNANLFCPSTQPNDVTRSGTVPNLRHLVHMAVIAELFQSNPSGATIGTLVCERACSMTSRAWDVSRDKVLVSCFYKGREDMSWHSEQDAQPHIHCAHPPTHFLADHMLTALVQWCGTARVQPLARWHGCCERSQNSSLTALNHNGNKAGDAGATALAQAVKETVLTCELYLF